MLTSDNTPLVDGDPVQRDLEFRTIRAVRGFLYAGRAVGPGTVLTVPRRLAAELCAVNKAQRVTEPSPEPEAVQPIPLEGTVHLKRARGRPQKETG